MPRMRGGAIAWATSRSSTRCIATGSRARCPDRSWARRGRSWRGEYGITREASDAYALETQRRAGAAIAEGRFASELAPVTITDREGPDRPRGGGRASAARHHPRCAREASAGIPPGGIITAGTSSGITDGGAAVVLMSAARAAADRVTPLARIIGWASAGVDPRIMGIGPVPAMRKLFARTGLSLADFDLFELNEAFAPQVLAVLRDEPIPSEKLNVNGGAIALGHPIGCTGTRIVVTLVHEMLRRKARRGLATLCVSGGMGMAIAVESDVTRHQFSAVSCQVSVRGYQLHGFQLPASRSRTAVVRCVRADITGLSPTFGLAARLIRAAAVAVELAEAGSRKLRAEVRIATIPGDGIGKEVTAEAVKVTARGGRAVRPDVRSRAAAVERGLLSRDRRHDPAGRLRPAAAVRRGLHRRAWRSACARQSARARHPARHPLRARSLRQLPPDQAAARAAVPAERTHDRGTSTSSSSARTPRACMSASAAGSSPGPKTRLPSRRK